MYDIIYQFVLQNIFNSTSLNSYSWVIGGQTINLNVWLSHTTTIASMIGFIICLVIFLKFLFKVCSGLFLLK